MTSVITRLVRNVLGILHGLLPPAAKVLKYEWCLTLWGGGRHQVDLLDRPFGLCHFSLLCCKSADVGWLSQVDVIPRVHSEGSRSTDMPFFVSNTNTSLSGLSSLLLYLFQSSLRWWIPSLWSQSDHPETSDSVLHATRTSTSFACRQKKAFFVNGWLTVALCSPAAKWQGKVQPHSGYQMIFVSDSANLWEEERAFCGWMDLVDGLVGVYYYAQTALPSVELLWECTQEKEKR